MQPGLSVPVRNGAVERAHAVRAVVPVGDAVSRMVEIRLSARNGFQGVLKVTLKMLSGNS